MLVGGRVEVYEFTTTLLRDPLVYRVYLPPCYDEHAEQFYPSLYLIHGQTYSDTQWDRLGVPETADRLIRNGEVPPFIVVMPRDRVWLEPTEDNFGKAVVQALVPWIDEHYRTLPDREHRAIGGLSRGGAWAVHIGLSNWDLFSRVGVHSGFVFYSDNQELYMWLYNTPEGLIPHIYMDVGDDDRPEIAAGSAWLEDFLTRFDIPHEWHMFEGEHEEAYWQAHVEDYLRWYTLEW
jgi:enterochelin esterase-like enzyme